MNKLIFNLLLVLASIQLQAQEKRQPINTNPIPGQVPSQEPIRPPLNTNLIPNQKVENNPRNQNVNVPVQKIVEPQRSTLVNKDRSAGIMPNKNVTSTILNNNQSQGASKAVELTVNTTNPILPKDNNTQNNQQSTMPKKEKLNTILSSGIKK